MNEEVKQRLLADSQSLAEDGDWSSLEALWKPYADAGDAEAQFQLAWHYLNAGFDDGGEPHRKMVELMSSVAARGHAEAMYWLAIHGYGENSEKCDLMLVRAAEMGSREAQRSLAVCYATGDWTGPRDPALGMHWYRMAAEQGQDDAQYNLGFMYLLGEGTSADPVEGLRWLRTAAHQGNMDALRLLADVYRQGLYGVTPDAAAAQEHERKFQFQENRQRDEIDAMMKQFSGEE